MTFKSIKYVLFLLLSTISFTLFATENSTNFENISELKMFIEAIEKNPHDIKDEDFKKITPLAMAATQSNTPFIKQSGLWLLQASIRQDTHFNQFDQAMEIVRKATKSSDVQVRSLGIAVLREVVIRHAKINEIIEEALRITHAAIKRGHEQEQCESFALYVNIINRDKEFNQFNNLAQAIDQAMQSPNKEIQASGIWLLYKNVKRNSRFDAFKKAHVVAKTGMASSHRGMRCHTAALLSALISREPRFSELPEVHRFAIAEVRRAMASKPMAKRRTISASFTNSIALLSNLVDRGIDFQKQEYATIQEAALQCIELFGPVDAKAWANSLNMLANLVERQMATTSIDQLTGIALHAVESSMPRVLSGGLRLLRTIILLNPAFVQFEAAEQAALRYVECDNTWVRRYAHEVLVALLQKDKLENRTILEHAANRIAHSNNDEKRETGRPLLNAVASTKHHNIFWVLGVTLIFLLLCYLVGSRLLDWIRNRRLRAMRKLGHKDWTDSD